MKRTDILVFALALPVGIGVFAVNKKTDKTIIEAHSSVAEKSLDELIDDSDIVIRGRVASRSKGRLTNPGFAKGAHIRNIIQSDVVFNTIDVYKGSPCSEHQITIKIEKGENESTIMIDDAMPDYRPGEEYILFLAKDDSDTAVKGRCYYIVTGYTQGVYSGHNGFYYQYVSPDEDVLTESILIDRIKSREEIE